MQALAGATVFACVEVLFIVGTHLQRDAGDVIAPASQNLAYDRIDALSHTDYNRIRLKLRLTTTGSLPSLETVLPALPGSAVTFAEIPKPFLLCLRPGRDGYSALTDAPALHTMHFHHIRCIRISRVSHSTSVPSDSRRAALPTMDTVPHATFPDRDWTRLPAHHIHAVHGRRWAAGIPDQ